MNLSSTLLKAGALYALGRFASNVSADDVARVTGLNGEDFKRYGLNRADALLGTMGLTRNSNLPAGNGTVLVLSGFAAGAIVGAGATFLFYSEQGKEVRQKIGEYFAGADQAENEGSDKAHAGNGGAKVNA